MGRANTGPPDRTGGSADESTGSSREAPSHDGERADRGPNYVRILRDGWRLVLVTTLLGAVAAAGVLWLRTPQYTATVGLYVAAPPTDSANGAYQGSLVAEKRVKSYTDLVASPQLTTEVVRRLGLPDDPVDLAEKVTATSAIGSVVIDVDVTADAPGLAAQEANTLGDVAVAFVNDLERPPNPSAVQPVSLRVVQPATPPTRSSSPSPPVVVALGLVGGAAAGVGLVLLGGGRRSRRAPSTPDDRQALRATGLRPDEPVTETAQLDSLVRAPSLGTIAVVAGTPAPVLAAVPTREAERLAFALQMTDIDQARRVLAVTGPSTDLGTSLTALHLATAWRATGHRVLVIDGDLRRRVLPGVLRLAPSGGLTTVLAGLGDLDTMVETYAPSRIEVLLPGPLPPDPHALMASQRMNDVLTEARARYDLVLFVAAAVSEASDVTELASAVDGVVLVARAGTTAATVAEAAGALRAGGSAVVGTVLTTTPSADSPAPEPEPGSGSIPAARTEQSSAAATQGMARRPMT